MCNNGCKGKECKFYSYFYTHFNTYDKGKLHEMCFHNEKKPTIIWNKETQDCPLDSVYVYHAVPKDICKLINNINDMLAKSYFHITPEIDEKYRLLEFLMHDLGERYMNLGIAIYRMPLWKKYNNLCKLINRLKEMEETLK